MTMRVPAAKWLAIAPPYLWLLLFFGLPFLIVLKISFAEPAMSVPPYTPLFARQPDGSLAFAASANTYATLFGDGLYARAFLNSARIAALATLVALLIGYPMAYGIARARESWRPGLMLLVMLPFWTSFLIRVYAWIGILKPNGLINNALIALGYTGEPLPLLHNDFAVVLGIVYSYLPFMVLPIYAALARQDIRLLEAAADLGATPWVAFWRVTAPLSLAGVAAGCLLVFIPAVGEFVVPDLLGGADALMIGKVLWAEFFANRDWPMASAAAVLLVAALVAPMMALQRAEREDLGEAP
ncbi:MAG: ABC transporter permease subunit [Alphaproteobacteria bacterium]|nr:ABC transporter permease subunit [Alphaproteobacteria bacterium]MBM3952812.1 ABC transporter permease subunit [Rhodospirillales bacterium]